MLQTACKSERRVKGKNFAFAFPVSVCDRPDTSQARSHRMDMKRVPIESKGEAGACQGQKARIFE
jgi:hypothetical protein